MVVFGGWVEEGDSVVARVALHSGLPPQRASSPGAPGPSAERKGLRPVLFLALPAVGLGYDVVAPMALERLLGNGCYLQRRVVRAAFWSLRCAARYLCLANGMVSPLR